MKFTNHHNILCFFLFIFFIEHRQHVTTMCVGMQACKSLCLCLHTQPIWAYKAALHWHVVDDRPRMMGMVISQVDLGTPWGMGSVCLSQDITTRHIPLYTPQAHEDDHIWYTDDILSLLWQHGLIFLLWHPLLCGCYSSQIYHFNGEIVRPEDYLRDKYIIACSFGIDRMSLCLTNSFTTKAKRYH